MLARVQGVYFDASGAPQNLTTAFETVNLAKDYFNQLPASVQRGLVLSAVSFPPFRTVTDSPARPQARPQPDKKEETIMSNINGDSRFSLAPPPGEYSSGLFSTFPIPTRPLSMLANIPIFTVKDVASW